MNAQQNSKIGYISKTHGLKGEVTVILEREVDWAGHTSLLVESNGNLIPYFIERTSGQPLKSFLKLEGIDSIEQAYGLKGCRIYMSTSGRPKLKTGQFYDDEVIDFEVRDENLGMLGRIKEIQNQGANRLMLVIDESKEILIPVNAPFIKQVNKTEKLIQIELPDGFLSF